MWWLSDYIAGLGVGLISLGFTVWTFIKAGIIERKAGIIENEVLRVKKEHLFSQRISDHKKIIKTTREMFKEKRKLLNKCDQHTRIQIHNELKEAAIECRSSCSSLLEKVPESLLKPINDLHDECHSFIDLMNVTVFARNVDDVFDKLTTAESSIVEFEKDWKARIQ